MELQPALKAGAFPFGSRIAKARLIFDRRIVRRIII
jgi:hypothetical protein